MTWTIGSITIIPQSIDDGFEQVIARLQPLASGTIYHTFGYEYDIKKISAYIVGTPDKLALINYNRTGLTYTLLNDIYSWGDYYVKGVQFKFEPVVFQTMIIDANHDCTDNVFTVDLTLWKNE